MRIGLVGPHHGFGLRYQNIDIARQLNVDRWLSSSGGPAPEEIRCRFDAVPRSLSDLELEAWLAGLDVVMFVERPAYANLTAVAARMGVCLVCVPNLEWLHPGQEWLDDVDLMLCPTRLTASELFAWKRRFQFGWQIRCVPWPIDTERFSFRRRDFCRRFVYIHGSGGASAIGAAGSPAKYRRKGGDLILKAAQQCPDIPFIVFAEQSSDGPTPSNVDLRPLPQDNRMLYCDGDVCVQPSRWEGLGLPLLECQASGMPLITSNALPMSEHDPHATIPVDGFRPVTLAQHHAILIPEISPDDLARTLRGVHRKWISLASRRARNYILREHSWRRRRGQIIDAISDIVLGR